MAVRRYTGKVDAPHHYPLIAVAGPTGSGKSHLALALAREFHGEIVNCDSLQIYRGLDIGTAKTPVAERDGVPHHLFDVLEPHQVFNAGDYAALARPIVRQIAGRGGIPILAGGTGFYLRALLDGLAPGPKRDELLRRNLAQRESKRPGALHRILRRLDPQVAERIHKNDQNKLIRAIEICILARRPATELFQQGRDPLQGFRVLKIVLDPPRAALHERIAGRTRVMFASGLLEEVLALLASGVPEDAKAFESIGYKQAIEVLGGHLSLPDAITLTTIATRQYAKRQWTWFRREPNIHWISDFGDSTEAIALARRLVSSLLI